MHVTVDVHFPTCWGATPQGWLDRPYCHIYGATFDPRGLKRKMFRGKVLAKWKGFHTLISWRDGCLHSKSIIGEIRWKRASSICSWLFWLLCILNLGTDEIRMGFSVLFTECSVWWNMKWMAWFPVSGSGGERRFPFHDRSRLDLVGKPWPFLCLSSPALPQHLLSLVPYLPWSSALQHLNIDIRSNFSRLSTWEAAVTIPNLVNVDICIWTLKYQVNSVNVQNLRD